jgi:hypothetical protein
MVTGGEKRRPQAGKPNGRCRGEPTVVGHHREARFVRFKREHEWRSKVKTSKRARQDSNL